MNRIENTSLRKIICGDHEFLKDETNILIQIVDPDREAPEPHHAFDEVYIFKFYDVEEFNTETELFCTENDAEGMVGILKEALETGANVTVHCTAGICRSGAVVEVAEMMGFTPVHNMRQPNSLVKRRMMKVLGWTYG